MKKRLLDLSILCSLVSIVVTAIINIQIAKVYLKADGKTRALFGLNEILSFGYQYYVVVLAILATILAIVGKTNYAAKKFAAIGFGIIAIVIVFLRIWRLFV